MRSPQARMKVHLLFYPVNRNLTLTPNSLQGSIYILRKPSEPEEVSVSPASLETFRTFEHNLIRVPDSVSPYSTITSH